MASTIQTASNAVQVVIGSHAGSAFERTYKTRYRGIGKNRNHLHILFASASWLMRARAVTMMG